jgi:hypothetical protein
MRVLGLLRADESSERGDPPSVELMERMGQFIEEAAKAGVVLDTNGLKPSSEGKRVTYANGVVTVTDGPFAETKELTASYALMQFDTWDDAVRWTTRFLEVLGEGQVELRPIFEPTDFGTDIFPPEAAAHEEGIREAMRQNATR